MVIVLSVVCIILSVLILILNRENSRLRALYEKNRWLIRHYDLGSKRYAELEGIFVLIESRLNQRYKTIPCSERGQLQWFINEYDRLLVKHDKLVAKHKRASKHCERMAKQIQVLNDSLNSLCNIHNKSVDYYSVISFIRLNKMRYMSYHGRMHKNKWQRATAYLKIFAEYIKYLHKAYKEIDPRYYRKPLCNLLNLEEFVETLKKQSRL